MFFSFLQAILFSKHRSHKFKDCQVYRSLTGNSYASCVIFLTRKGSDSTLAEVITSRLYTLWANYLNEKESDIWYGRNYIPFCNYVFLMLLSTAVMVPNPLINWLANTEPQLKCWLPYKWTQLSQSLRARGKCLAFNMRPLSCLRHLLGTVSDSLLNNYYIGENDVFTLRSYPLSDPARHILYVEGNKGYIFSTDKYITQSRLKCSLIAVNNYDGAFDKITCM